jgi:hypothetical protein
MNSGAAPSRTGSQQLVLRKRNALVFLRIAMHRNMRNSWSHCAASYRRAWKRVAPNQPTWEEVVQAIVRELVRRGFARVTIG